MERDPFFNPIHPTSVYVRAAKTNNRGITEYPKRLDAAGGAIPASAFRKSIR